MIMTSAFSKSNIIESRDVATWVWGCVTHIPNVDDKKTPKKPEKKHHVNQVK